MLKFGLIDENVASVDNTKRFDALTALVSLGFDKKSAEKALQKVFSEDATVELLIKNALKVL
jgi:Holliday junction DNA helicase RuvA